MSCGDWQTIDSAPKDGSPVLAMRADWDLPMYVHWIKNPRTETEFWNDWHELDAYELEVSPPTHWLPAASNWECVGAAFVWFPKSPSPGVKP